MFGPEKKNITKGPGLQNSKMKSPWLHWDVGEPCGINGYQWSVTSQLVHSNMPIDILECCCIQLESSYDGKKKHVLSIHFRPISWSSAVMFCWLIASGSRPWAHLVMGSIPNFTLSRMKMSNETIRFREALSDKANLHPVKPLSQWIGFRPPVAKQLTKAKLVIPGLHCLQKSWPSCRYTRDA